MKIDLNNCQKQLLIDILSEALRDIYNWRNTNPVT